MKHTLAIIAGAFTLAVMTGSCRKEDPFDNLPYQQEENGYKKKPLNPCSFFFYSDTVFYLNELGNEVLVNPANPMKGKYGSIPKGLAIDSTTGQINVTESETGLRYKVFLAKGGFDTCFKYVTVSGVNYLDSIYVIEDGAKLASPIYNASLSASIPCSDDDEEEDDDACEFDDGDDDDGPGDEPPAGQEISALGFDINKTTGVINLKKTVLNGVFGTIPENGTSIDVTLYYRLADASNLALNFIDLRFYYFDTMDDVPADLIEEMQDKTDITYLLGKVSKTRPPYIVIVGK